jgi:hypothetical protein
MLALFDGTVPFGILHFAPDLLGRRVLSDFENGGEKGELGWWILHELSGSWDCGEQA